MIDGGKIFQDREEAGHRLAVELVRYREESPVVFALPRGGVPVGYEVARALEAPLDVVVARKLGAPGQPELGIGAVAPGGVRLLNQHAVQQLGIPEDYLESITEEENEEVRARLHRLRGERPEIGLEGRTAILVDDGLATGVTARAAIQYLRGREPREIVLAAPVCAVQTAEVISEEVEELVVLEIPAELGAIGFWYRSFEQVSDEEVLELLERSWGEGPG